MSDDKYELVRLLGQGGMGSVHEARNRLTGKRVAIKKISPALASDPDAVQRFLREARAATSIAHPNVVEIYDVGVADGAPFMVMEMLEGEPLSGLREKRGRLPAAEIAEILAPSLRALGAAHALGIVHRDLKPDNIFLSKASGGRVLPKVLDFGISKVAGESDMRLTKTGAVMGTPYYMAPEQASGRKDLDHRADVYSMGVILYECLTGRLPFVADNYNALILAILTADAIPIRTLAPEVPVAAEEVVMRAMARDVARRFASMDELCTALLAAVGRNDLGDAEIRTARVGEGGSLSVSQLPPIDPHAQTTLGGSAYERIADSVSQRPSTTPTARRASPMLWGGAAFAALLLVGGAAVTIGFVASPGPTRAERPSAPTVPDAPSAEVRTAAGGGSGRLDRALACASVGDQRCVVDALHGSAETPVELALLVDAFRALDDRAAAEPLARSYVERFPAGPRAEDYRTYLAAALPEGVAPPPHGEVVQVREARARPLRAGAAPTIEETAPAAQARPAEALAEPRVRPAEPAAGNPPPRRAGALSADEF